MNAIIYSRRRQMYNMTGKNAKIFFSSPSDFFIARVFTPSRQADDDDDGRTSKEERFEVIIDSAHSVLK